MPDKEERIEISTYDLNNKEWNGDIPIDIHKVYTRQKAIEVIEKRLIFEGVNYFECNAIAKWCLDALLGGIRK